MSHWGVCSLREEPCHTDTSGSSVFGKPGALTWTCASQKDVESCIYACECSTKKYFSLLKSHLVQVLYLHCPCHMKYSPGQRFQIVVPGPPAPESPEWACQTADSCSVSSNSEDTTACFLKLGSSFPRAGELVCLGAVAPKDVWSRWHPSIACPPFIGPCYTESLWHTLLRLKREYGATSVLSCLKCKVYDHTSFTSTKGTLGQKKCHRKWGGGEVILLRVG